ncbi:peroxisomal membrane protein PMP34 isoform X2 [Austrofundulus limnaeus]|uniref:Peroxisomal membrane protein PMP34 isoform X2 n=1 Tax=Austrofundulus limnaeus TaxID=52670 RepID=A0A2I4B3S3_AUSLI|nr:PREDICTED: peroxisomal membrane protein PMP34 isoform X2 [Austrofundulus limnaeus]
MNFEVFSYESLVHAVAGAMGSVTAMTVFFPLDTARLRLQVDENRKSKSTPAILVDIVKEEGFIKASLLKGKPSTPSTDLMIGIAAGVVNVLITTPLWVVNTRLKLQGSKFHNPDIRPTNYSGILDALVQISHQEGIGALWNGTVPSLLLVLNPAVQFMIYEGLKRQLMRGVPRELSSLEVFVIGAVAKAVATTVTYPLQTIQSILRFGQFSSPTDKSRLLSSLRTIKSLLVNRFRKYGILGLFKGLEAKLLQTVLTAALMFILYEKIASFTFKVMGLSNSHYKKR